MASSSTARELPRQRQPIRPQDQASISWRIPPCDETPRLPQAGRFFATLSVLPSAARTYTVAPGSKASASSTRASQLAPRYLTRAKRAPASIQLSNPARFESWIDAGARLARVRYRGASWEARVEDADALEPGATVYVLAADGNTLKVAKNRPA